MNKIETLRRAANISRQTLADEVGVTVVSVFRYERGQQGLSLDMAAKIARALGVRVDDLIEEDKKAA